jgi:hypothetical protein
MKNILFVLLFIYSTSIFSLEISRVKNVELKELYIYDGSRQYVEPEDGVVVYVKGKANKMVRISIKHQGAIYLTEGVRIQDLKAKKPVISLDKYGEGQFELGFSLVGEKKVGGKHRKQIKYEIKYEN